VIKSLRDSAALVPLDQTIEAGGGKR
jgi:hypothetical protein